MRVGGYVVSNGVGSGVFNLTTEPSCLVVALAITRLLRTGQANHGPAMPSRQHATSSR